MPFTLVDRILFNGHIRTLDDAQPVVSALAISDGRIVASGTDDEIIALASLGTARENLNGRHVVPGMTDAHLHWRLETEPLQNVQLYSLPSRNAALERVAARAAEKPAGTWIIGYGWSQDDWDDRRFPTAHDLDTVAPDHPVYLVSRSAHAGWANSLALRIAGIDANTPNPDGGEIAHDETGTPSGLLLEPAAMRLVSSKIPVPTVDELATQMKQTQALAHSLGITGFHDFDDQDCFAALQVMRERGELGLRVVKNFNNK